MSIIKNKVVIEYNDDGYLMYSETFPGAYTRGREQEIALSKFPGEIKRYCKWAGIDYSKSDVVESIIIQSKESDLPINDADSDVIFVTEQAPFSEQEYKIIKNRVLKSAKDFQVLYDSIPNKDYTSLKKRKSFHGDVPRTSKEMYVHTNNVTNYYVGEIGVKINSVDNIYKNRIQAIKAIENIDKFLQNKTYIGSYGELWTLRKVLRRFIWHDHIHAKGMYRMAVKEWDEEIIKNPFYFRP
ncbi:hypothetical protein [Aquisalibacillus elongatus]|uniref:Uncharacterized protein n=1 Tax=Aquisalibacillus elongatus TaxID=485577 RepID=A0A3N5CBK5_9BACI|nr:hypothetical protein [Aquisalibacillus elongatus]RPF56155.1 hypothetical protein EDC24_1044 [Aquisalibacillus elongatus]